MPARLNIHYECNAHQQEFHDDVTTDFLALIGGYGSGKTFGLVHKVLMLSWLNRPFRGGLVAPSIPEYKKDVQPVFEQIIEDHRMTRYFHYVKSDRLWHTPWRAPIEVATAEKRIRGPNWAFACVNEATMISKERFLEVVGRVRIKEAKHPQVAISGTPEGLAHYVYEDFVDKPMPGSKIIHGDTRANQKNLHPNYLRNLESAYDPIMLQAYMAGLFVNMQGNQFYYSYDPMRNHDRTLRPIMPNESGHTEFWVSLDFNIDPMCATVWQKRGAKLCGVDQIELKPHNLGGHPSLTDAMAGALKTRGYLPEFTTIYPDPAGKARSTSGNPDITILKQAGFDKIKYKSSAPQFRKRQLCTNNLLANGTVVFNPDVCTGMKRDLEAVEQDQGDFSKIKDNPKLTHYSDGFDYMTDIEFPLSGTKPDSRMQRIR